MYLHSLSLAGLALILPFIELTTHLLVSEAIHETQNLTKGVLQCVTPRTKNRNSQSKTRVPTLDRAVLCT
jgi:hypothetical protein